MRVFVTGATGFVGSAVVQELLAHGHQVTALARSEASAKALSAIGVDVHPGDLANLDSLRAGAASVDGVIHTAFDLDMTRFVENCTMEGEAIKALGSGLAGTNRPLVVTAGMVLAVQGRASTEKDMPPPPEVFPRDTDSVAAELAKSGIHTSVVRLPPLVHGQGDGHGFAPLFIQTARAKAVSAYVGEGQNRWPAVHCQDAAVVFRLAVEKAAPEAIYHAAAEEGVPFEELAATIGEGLHLPVVSKTTEEASEHFGWLAMFAGMDLTTSSKRTRDTLKWTPKHLGVLADLKAAKYFES